MNLLKILDGTPEPPIIDLHLDLINDSGDYALPTPMYDFQKELTDQIVSLHYPDILKYCELGDSRDIIVKLLEICIGNCRAVATHPYLLIDHYMPKNLFMRDMPAKLAETSGKFNVLKDLINVIISTGPPGSGSKLGNNPKRHIAVVMTNAPRYFDLVEALLVGGCATNKWIRRYVGNPNKNNKPHPNADTVVHLVPADGIVTRDEEVLAATKFDVVILFDGLVDTELEYLRKLRTQNRRGEAVVIRLVPMRTIEHIQLYYERNPSEAEGKDILYRLVLSIVCLRDHVGTLPPDIVPIFNQKLSYLASPFFGDVFRSSARLTSFPAWPLPELPSIPKFTASDVERLLLTEVHFHYTPYDNGDELPPMGLAAANGGTIPTYYETKRLMSDYVTNPLRNDYDKLIGIHLNTFVGGHGTDNTKFTPNLLTHKLILQLNNAINAWEAVNEELEIYQHYASNTQQEKFGRRRLEFGKALLAITLDIDHAQLRVSIANKKLATRTCEIEALKAEIDASQAAVNEYLERVRNKITATTNGEANGEPMEVDEPEKATASAQESLEVKPDGLKVEDDAEQTSEKTKEALLAETVPLTTSKSQDPISMTTNSQSEPTKSEPTQPESKENSLQDNAQNQTGGSAPVQSANDLGTSEAFSNVEMATSETIGTAAPSNEPLTDDPSECASGLKEEPKKTDEVTAENSSVKPTTQDEDAKPRSPRVPDSAAGSSTASSLNPESSKPLVQTGNTDAVSLPNKVASELLAGSDGDGAQSHTLNGSATLDLTPNAVDELSQKNGSGYTSEFKTYYNNQLEVWRLQEKIKETLERIESKRDERAFIAKEVENCQKSIADSTQEIATTQKEIEAQKIKWEAVKASEIDERKRFAEANEVITKRIRQEKTTNDELRLNLAESLRLLRLTPHLKKRKGRTPNKT